MKSIFSLWWPAMLLSGLLFGGTPATAQTTPLPYYTGFDNAAQKAGWAQARTGAVNYPQWEIGPGGGSAPTAPNILSHDYPVGHIAGDTVVDYMLSPPFNFQYGGKVQSLKVNVFAITGQSRPSDELSIFLMKEISPNSVIVVAKLADLTQLASNSNNWHDTGNFTIPPTTGTCYIAIKYKAVDNWFVPQIDNISITGNAGTGLAGQMAADDGLVMYPNPATDKLHLSIPQGESAGVTVTNAAGQPVLQKAGCSGAVSLDISALPAGCYILTGELSSGKRSRGRLSIVR